MCCILYKCYINHVKVIRWIPVIVEFVVIAWTYYVYVVAMCLQTSDIHLEKILLLIGFHLLMLMGVWCQIMAVFTRPMKPPAEFKYSEDTWHALNNEYVWIQRREEVERLRLKLDIQTTQTLTGQSLIAYCVHCKMIKPDRCHHCSRCGTCVLKMDHHCPWINNCVGFHNYKYFVLFAIYTFACSIYIPATSARFVIGFVLDLSEQVNVSDDINRIQIVAMSALLILIGLALIPLLKLHYRLLFRNVTTLENSRPLALVGKQPDPTLFDLGSRENFRLIFGHRRLLWFFPVYTSIGDGAHFRLREDIF